MQRVGWLRHALVGVTACIGTASFAADLPPRPTPPPPLPAWTYIAMPYAWLPSVNGTSTVRGRSSKIDASLGEILDRPIPEELFGLMGAFEARNGRFAVMTDLTYMKLGVSDSGARARSVHPHIAGTLAAAVSVQFKMFIAEAALAYELARWGGATPGTGTSIDLYGGGRFWWQNAEASLALTAGLSIADLAIHRGRAVAASGDVTWLDPLVGLRLRHHFSPATELVLRADIGGFGAGSDLTWQAMGYLKLGIRPDRERRLERHGRLPGALCRLLQRPRQIALRVRHADARAGPGPDGALLIRGGGAEARRHRPHVNQASGGPGSARAPASERKEKMWLFRTSCRVAPGRHEPACAEHVCDGAGQDARLQS
jgi:hypothetical protein